MSLIVTPMAGVRECRLTGAGSENRNVLLIEADETVRQTVASSLREESFRVAEAAHGERGLEQALSGRFALIVTEVYLPGIDGLKICKSLRSSGIQTPIIVVSAAAEETDKVMLLDGGADDFLVKPVRLRELLARIRAVLRRAGKTERTVSFAAVYIDTIRRIVTRSGRVVKLSAAEYRLLQLFLSNQDCPLSRFTILDSVWGAGSCHSVRTVDSYVMRLRHKLETVPAYPRHFLAHKNQGYRFVP
jgi:DNA-binding response OmpR family regulator